MARSTQIFALIVLFCAAVILAASGSEAHKGKAPRRTPAAHLPRPIATVKGTFIGFEVGDYMHAVIKDSRGRRRSFYLNKPGMEYFLSMHRSHAVVCFYETVKAVIPEAGGPIKIERLTDVEADRHLYSAWWKDMRAKAKSENLEERFGSLVKAATITK